MQVILSSKATVPELMGSVMKSPEFDSKSYKSCYLVARVSLVMKHPEFDPLGVAGVELEATLRRHQSSRNVCSFSSLETLSLSKSCRVCYSIVCFDLPKEVRIYLARLTICICSR
jgi:hypothetical protein